MKTSPNDYSSIANSLPTSVRTLEGVDSRNALSIILGVSIAAILFLVWLIYFKAPASQ